MQRRLRERTSRVREFSVLEATRHRATSAESVSRLRISTTRDGGRSSIEKIEEEKGKKDKTAEWKVLEMFQTILLPFKI